MDDPLWALDFDMAIATRARQALSTELHKIIDDPDGGLDAFFTAVVMLLSE